MEDATTKDYLYQQGRYPSIVDTDDLVFELGKQLIGNINKEKLLDSIIKKNTEAETTISDERVFVAGKMTALELSNNKYIENNRNLDNALVITRNKLMIVEDKLIEKEKELSALKKEKKKSPKKKRSK